MRKVWRVHARSCTLPRQARADPDVTQLRATTAAAVLQQMQEHIQSLSILLVAATRGCTWNSTRQRGCVKAAGNRPFEVCRSRPISLASCSPLTRGSSAASFGRRLQRKVPDILRRRKCNTYCAVRFGVALGFGPDSSTLATHLVGGPKVSPEPSAVGHDITSFGTIYTANVQHGNQDRLVAVRHPKRPLGFAGNTLVWPACAGKSAAMVPPERLDAACPGCAGVVLCFSLSLVHWITHCFLSSPLLSSVIASPLSFTLLLCLFSI